MKTMRKILTTITFTFLISASVFAQKADDAKDALAVVNRMFAEMANHNPAAIAALYAPDANLAAVIKTKEGKSVVRSFTGEKFSQNFAVKKGELHEAMYAPETRVFGDLALVYGRYVFFTDNKISHCGVNAFHLVRTDAGWRIANASTTIEPQGCTEKEKAMKASVPVK